MGFWLEVEVRFLAPGFNGDVVFLGLAGRDFMAGEVGNAGEGEAHLLVERGRGLVELVELVFEGARLVHDCRGVFAFTLESGDLLAQLVAAGFVVVWGGGWV